MSTERPSHRRLSRSRREAEQRFRDLAISVERETGWAPRGPWLKPAVAFAVGMALALGGGRRRKKTLVSEVPSRDDRRSTKSSAD